jgi:catechol 2,3-dioxygenase-like lactoylglutathione lyase family enzyme
MTSISVRYVVNDVDEAIEFYRDRLGFDVEMHPAPGFAALRKDGLSLLLNAPGAGGAGTAGGAPEPGGWNRFQLVVENLGSTVDRLRREGATFRGELVEGRGGSQILLEDPSGNPVELFEPAVDGMSAVPGATAR